MSNPHGRQLHLPHSLPIHPHPLCSLPFPFPAPTPHQPSFTPPLLQNFFGHLAYFRQMNNRTGGNFTFPEFVRLVEYGMRFDRRKNMDNHLAPQSLLCGLDRIRYDLVGRFERMEEDVKAVMMRLGRQPGDAFDFGKKIHPTKSRDQLLQLYSDAVSALVVPR
ncbi:unnamed protein product, partial [Closterium sp. NIES-53]